MQFHYAEEQKNKRTKEQKNKRTKEQKNKRIISSVLMFSLTLAKKVSISN